MTDITKGLDPRIKQALSLMQHECDAPIQIYARLNTDVYCEVQVTCEKCDDSKTITWSMGEDN